ncbi:MAG: thioredoxin family protein [Deltaproteobacteria bacterium]|nr:thioredoxin family protein [Deltaproteobacteria bacterium]
MSLIAVRSEEEFDRVVAPSKDPVVVGFFGSFSTASKRAETTFREFSRENPQQPVMLVDVGRIKGIHKRFGVSSVPTVISVTGSGEVVQKVIGEQDASYYERAFLDHAQVMRRDGEDGPRFPPITVYVSDTCSWCTRVKAYLRKQRVPFHEVNVSRDPSAASALTAKTGQMGVPQLDIGGKYVVGFDKARIDDLLGLSPGGQA